MNHRGFQLPREKAPASGIALVIVLTILVLILGLVTIFLARTRVERGATSAYSASSATQRLADLATSMVKGQIRDATTQGNAVAWMSQPGMIRTYGTGTPGNFTAGSNLLRVFKLYSAQELISTTYANGGDTPPGSWVTSTALWTDLNAPVMRDNPDAPSGPDVPRYPILDPAAQGSVEGFSITSSEAPAGSVLSGSSGAQRLPMPVRWLYVLQDGTMVTPPETSGTTASISGATTANPIVGRIAFWTDDETCKININTASEGSYWDTPRVDTTEDRKLANYQPAQNEFQRYPGHPAMVSLAPVFFATSSTNTPDLSATQREALYLVAPRIVGGGSDAGSQMATGALSPDTDRLYASVDELAFAADRQDQMGITGLTREKLEAAKFFLTASSQAPETTLFNTPRVAMWPIFKDLPSTRVTAYDRLIAFASTINGQPYYFQRAAARSTTADWINIPRNRKLLRYLRALSDKAEPGFGASLVSKTSATDRDQLLVAMMDYIRSTNLYDDNLSPGTYATDAAAQSAVQFTSGRQSDGVSVWSGHGAVAPLRVPSGLADTSSYPAEPDTTSLMGFGRFHTISEAALLFICTADGSAGTSASPAPSDPVEAAKRESNNPGTNNTLGGTALTPTQRRIQAMLFFDLFSAMQGWTQYSVDSSIDVELVGGNFTINNTSLAFPISAKTTQDNQQLDNYSPWGGYMGFRKSLTSANWVNYPLISVPITIEVPTGSNPTMHFKGPQTIKIKIYAKPPASRGPGDTDLVQTIELRFPEANFPVPELRTSGTASAGTTPATVMQNWWTFTRTGIGGSIDRGRLYFIKGQSANNSAGNIIWPEDTLRTLIPYHGDLRLIAGSHYVPVGVFRPSTGYFDTTRRAGTGTQEPSNPLPQIKNSLTGSSRSSYEGGEGFSMPQPAERLVENAAYSAGILPKFGPFLDEAGSTHSARAYQAYGDFDNGTAVTADGAYLNKPDEGNNARSGGSIPYFGQSWVQAASGPTFFSPNRQVPGPGMFGSLPTRLFSGNQPFETTGNQAVDRAWRTLLVHPQSGHPGAANPPDHLWLDLFWMPVVEPYAISSPFATAGKINMNYEIEPFTYIRRATGLVSLLRSEQVLAIPNSDASRYKGDASGSQAATFRLSIDAHETLKQFDARFQNDEVFLSPTEICDVHLIPKGETINSAGTNADSVMTSFWQSHAVTGDNSRERPYTNIQSRLTTKSNTYTVHYRVQTLKKRPGGNAAVWNEATDSVTGELRGSETIERYINPNDTTTPDYAELYSDNPSANPADLGTFYKWRTINSRKFQP